MTAQEEVFAMSVVTLIGAGQMASALTFPLLRTDMRYGWWEVHWMMRSLTGSGRIIIM